MHAIVWACNFAGQANDKFAMAVLGVQTTASVVGAASCQDLKCVTNRIGCEPCRQVTDSSEPQLILDLPDRFVMLKPPGWEVYDQSTERQLLLWLQAMEAQSSSILRDRSLRHGFIHRLDVPTSGLILAAKSYHAYMRIHLQLAAGSMIRDYVILVHGWVAPSLRQLNVRVSWGADDRTTAAGQGKASTTHLKARKHILRQTDALTLAIVRIRTGRRHQIRSHLSHVGHPVVRDGMYAALPTFDHDSSICDRNCLHRIRLRFGDSDGSPYEARDPLSPDFLAALRRPAAQS
eukprot:TRINITY_DN13753_c0_g4_i1.p1 TRINITY_DN13753_c0_g4~~TRINITY_DN13753_c0_g4_i1.p1  ORF type:complete len:335 (+),score=26.31 TRINITY_DN13753_c0_g4_i1:133-1005(+)